MSTDTVILIAVSIMIAVDCIYGTVGALVTNTFSSAKMRAGLMHKAAEYVVLLVAYVIQWVLASGVDLGSTGVLQCDIPTYTAVGAFLIAMEAGSVLELCVKFNPDLAENRFLKAFARKADENGGK